MRIAFRWIVGLVLLAPAASATAGLELSPVFGDGMVLQRDRPLRIWGRAEANADVRVSFADHRVAARADERGAWEAALPPLAADAQGRDLRVESADEAPSGGCTGSTRPPGCPWLRSAPTIGRYRRRRSPSDRPGDDHGQEAGGPVRPARAEETA